MKILGHHEYSSIGEITAHTLPWHAAADSITACVQGLVEREGELAISVSRANLANSIIGR